MLPLLRPAVTARPKYHFPPHFYPHHLYALLTIIFIPIKQNMLRLVQPCQPRLSNLTLLLYCFLGHQVDHHMALLANHWYLLILLFLFYLFYLYHHHPSLLHLAIRPHLPQAGLCVYPVYLLIIHHPKDRLAVLYHSPIVY